ncbi:hypothetical protein EBT31_22155 [bacterium]|nr:hypothetical protein [bacterium]
MGAGKSTLAERLRPKYDAVFTTDTGRVVDGAYVQPPSAEKVRIRAERAQEILRLHGEGKRVLLEGFPSGVLKFPEVIEKADRVLHLDLPAWKTVLSVGRRSFQRGTPVLPDVRMALRTHREEGAHLAEIEKAHGRSLRRIARDYAEPEHSKESETALGVFDIQKTAADALGILRLRSFPHS